MTRDETLLRYEQRLARIGGKVSAEEAAGLIADDFIEFGSSGRVWSKADIVPAMAQWEPVEASIADFAVRELAPAVCLVTYTLGQTLRSSIWRSDGERWQLIFHQGTRPPAAR